MPRSYSIAVASIIVSCGSVAPHAAAQSVLRAQLFDTARGVYLPGGPGQRRPAVMGGSYSLHAGSIAGGSTDFTHAPGLVLPPDPGQDIFPTVTVFRRDELRNMNVPMAARATPSTPWPTLPKNFNGVSNATNSLATATAPNGLSTTSVAWAQINMNSMPTRVDSEGSLVSVVQQKNGAARGPFGSAGNLVLDPTYFSALAGDTLAQGLTLGGGQIAQVDADGWASMTIQMGANFPGLSPGSLGMSHAGNPVFAQVSLSFLGGDATPSVDVQFASETGGMIFNTPDGTAMSTSQLAQQITNTLSSAATFAYDPAAGSWSLADDLSLFSFSQYFQDDMSNVAVDFSVAGMAALPCAAPGAGVLAILGVGLAAGRRRRR